MADKYDAAIEYLTQNPDKIGMVWRWRNEPHHCLFQRAGEGRDCGCLTQIRCKNWPLAAQTAELTSAIRNDSRIPDVDDITVSDLPVFAEWQRKLDRELKRI